MMSSPNFWDIADTAQKISQERVLIADKMNVITTLQNTLEEARMFITLGEDENDLETIEEGEAALSALITRAERQQLDTLLSGEADNCDTFLEVHAGAGGTEAQDWAEMLTRMYVRWAEERDFKTEWIQETMGEEVGIKSVTLKIQGPKAYGWLKTESGIHRLVRISPFDANARRHTSFASIWVYPVLDDAIKISVEEKDLRIDTYRASGAGGQHVNTTDSAIRITHVPTGIVVQCQNDRSQHRNKAQAMSMLRARLYELEMQKKEEEANSSHADKSAIGWGHQIRSYILHPYQMVKDLRTNHETGNANAVLEGKIEPFLAASLVSKACHIRHK